MHELENQLSGIFGKGIVVNPVLPAQGKCTTFQIPGRCQDTERCCHVQIDLEEQSPVPAEKCTVLHQDLTLQEKPP